MNKNILIHRLNTGDLRFVDGKQKEDNNLFLVCYNYFTKYNHILKFHKLLLQLPFDEDFINRILYSKGDKILIELNDDNEIVNANKIKLNDFKIKIKRIFSEQLKIEVQVFGPDRTEIQTLRHFIIDIQNDKNPTNIIYNKYVLYNLSDDYMGYQITNLAEAKKSETDENQNKINANVPKYDWENVNLIYYGAFTWLTGFINYPRNDYFFEDGFWNPPEVSELIYPKIQNVYKTLEEIPKEFNSIRTLNKQMIELIGFVKYLSKSNENILISGETGTGKELFAQSIHKASLLEPIVPVNCAMIPKELAESILFGHKRGSFSGAHNDQIGLLKLADNGTLYLDEIGEIGIEVQAKLLRAIETKKFLVLGDNKETESNFRLICATNKNIMNDSLFREDLFSRIAGQTIDVIPLRERGENDIILLSRYFLSYILYDNKIDRNKFYFDSDALNMICNHDWPLNVRQLKNFISKVFYAVDYRIQTKKKNYEKNGSVIIYIDDIMEILQKEKTNINKFSARNDNINSGEKMDSIIENNKLFKVDINSVGNLNDFLKKIEKAYLEAAMKENPDQKAIAKLFGYTNQSKVSTRMTSLGLNYKIGKKSGRV